MVPATVQYSRNTLSSTFNKNGRTEGSASRQTRPTTMDVNGKTVVSTSGLKSGYVNNSTNSGERQSPPLPDNGGCFAPRFAFESTPARSPRPKLVWDHPGL